MHGASRSAQLQTKDLVDVLGMFGDRYHLVNVFADDLSDGSMEDVHKGAFTENDRVYRFTVFPMAGVMSLHRWACSGPSDASKIDEAIISQAITTARKQRGQGFLRENLFALLVGGVLGNPTQVESRIYRVFAMKMNTERREWMAYDGGLLRWMKVKLLAPIRDSPDLNELKEKPMSTEPDKGPRTHSMQSDKDFSETLTALRQGKKARREDWLPGVFLQIIIRAQTQKMEMILFNDSSQGILGKEWTCAGEDLLAYDLEILS